MFWYGISNIISPQLWQEKDGPRYVPAWVVQIVLSFFIAPLTSVAIWYVLRSRNKERLLKIESTCSALIEKEGGLLKTNVAMLDLTDLENDSFIYPL